MEVFISHSFEKDDKILFDNLCAAFAERQIPYWDPGEMPAGASLRDRLHIAIKKCTLCVFIATENSLKSAWCNAELGAFWGLKKPVVVFLADPNVTEDLLPMQFKGDIYTPHQSKVIQSVRSYLAQSIADPFAPVVVDLKDPAERIQYFTTMHDRSKSLFSVSMGYDITDRAYYSKEQTDAFIASVRRIILDQERRYERYQIVNGAPRSWLRFLVENASNAPHCYIWYLNAPEPAVFRTRMMQIAVSDDKDEAIGKVSYLVTSLETGASHPYALRVRHRDFADAFEGQVSSYYQMAYKRFGIDSNELARQLDLDENERKQIIIECVESEYATLALQDEDDAMLTVIRRTNSLDHGLIREVLRARKAEEQAAGE